MGMATLLAPSSLPTLSNGFLHGCGFQSRPLLVPKKELWLFQFVDDFSWLHQVHHHHRKLYGMSRALRHVLSTFILSLIWECTFLFRLAFLPFEFTIVPWMFKNITKSLTKDLAAEGESVFWCTWILAFSGGVFHSFSIQHCYLCSLGILVGISSKLPQVFPHFCLVTVNESLCFGLADPW